uniref:Uncharacterized protein n=1 Tax=Anopheles dirus TaxID=7168 RepID=A0A182NI70_9DIPT
MLPTSARSRSASSAAAASPSSCVRMVMVVALLPALPLLLLLPVLLLPGAVQGDYENTWNSYYEQPCCGGTANGPFHLRHHGGSS